MAENMTFRSAIVASQYQDSSLYIEYSILSARTLEKWSSDAFRTTSVPTAPGPRATSSREWCRTRQTAYMPAAGSPSTYNASMGKKSRMK